MPLERLVLDVVFSSVFFVAGPFQLVMYTFILLLFAQFKMLYLFAVFFPRVLYLLHFILFISKFIPNRKIARPLMRLVFTNTIVGQFVTEIYWCWGSF